MLYACNLDEDVHYKRQNPQGRAETDPPTIYAVVQRMPIEADERFGCRIKTKSERVEREWLRKTSFRIRGDLAHLVTAGVWSC